ncbi:uncharacterized protein [Coffea arabica]|uniref:Uncharacterized protein n=1 Tax=Coffea arabica TaxID=13443 RepID=A0ABM4UYY8_COFAR
MEATTRYARGKGRRDHADCDADVQVVGANEEKGKTGKGKWKSGDASSYSPMSTASGSVTDRYFRTLDTIELLVSRKKSSSMSVSVSSSTKHRSGRDGSKKSEYDVAITELRGLENVAYVAKIAAAEILKDPQELAIWNLVGSDANRITFMKRRGCLPPKHGTQELSPPPPL